MEFEKPINNEEYVSFYNEIYTKKNDRTVSRYSVNLDEDPTMNPKGINQKLAEVQAYKDRVVVILNRALQNEAFWKTKIRGLESMYEHEVNMALCTDSVKNAGNAGVQKAVATRMANAVVVAKIAARSGQTVPDDKPLEFQDILLANNKKFAHAQSFLNEIRNIYSNLDSASMALTVQLKSVMMNARIGGDGWVHGGENDGAGSR